MGNSFDIYKSILKDQVIFQNCTSHIIHNGETTNIWFDSWINNMPLRKQIVGTLSLCEDEKKVSCIYNLNRTWASLREPQQHFLCLSHRSPI